MLITGSNGITLLAVLAAERVGGSGGFFEAVPELFDLFIPLVLKPVNGILQRDRTVFDLFTQLDTVLIDLAPFGNIAVFKHQSRPLPIDGRIVAVVDRFTIGAAGQV